MKSKSVSITLAVLALLFGVVWFWTVLALPLIRCLSKDAANRDYVLLFTILPMMSLPGILAVWFGVRLLIKSSEKNIKGAVGILMVALTLRLSPYIQPLFQKVADEELARGMSFLVGTVIAVILYLVLAKWALRASGFPVAGIRQVMGRVPLLLIAWQLWSVGSRLFDVYSPKKGGYGHFSSDFWVTMARLLVPFLAAWLFYRISLKAFGIRKWGAEPLGESRENAAGNSSS